MLEFLEIANRPKMSEESREAGDKLRRGELVAFPTETVYGLGANALMDSAVQAIFTAKGRPSDNPLIVHVPNLDAARPLVETIPDLVELLAAKFWPGPLSIVMKLRADSGLSK
jgi:L-threonylcarbamoyladenylate synthase